MSRKKIIAAVIVVFLVLTYFGLGIYASSQAQERLEAVVDANDLAAQVSWQAVSASPFGGRVTIQNLEFGDGSGGSGLSAYQVKVSDIVGSPNRSRVRIDITGLSFSPSVLNDLQRLAGATELGATLNRFGPLSISGRTELKPFDMHFFIDVDDDSQTLNADIAMDVPELFALANKTRIDNQRGLNQVLRSLLTAVAQAPRGRFSLATALSGPLGDSLAIANARAQLREFELTYKDNGLVPRAVALQKRYNTPLDPGGGPVEQQRETYFAKTTIDMQSGCERSAQASAPMLVNGCVLGMDMLNGKSSGLRLTIDAGSDPVRIQELPRLFEPSKITRLLERLKPKVSAL